MKKRDSYSGTKCWLLTLLLVVCLLSAANTVEGLSKPLIPGKFLNLTSENFSEVLPLSQEGGTTQIRHHVLFSECSNKPMRIFKKGSKGVDAMGQNKRDDYAKLVFETTASGNILIYGPYTMLQLCFNSRGKLVTRTKSVKAKKARSRGKLCEFKEVPSADGNTWQYRSAHNRTWFLGFRKNGKPLKGVYRYNKADCYKFQKLLTRTRNPCRKGAGPPVLCPSFPQLRRHRHGHRERERRKG